MDKKLLLVTAGTIAAGVGQEFLRQMDTRSGNKKRLYAVVRSIDTTDLSNTYSNLLSGKSFTVGIDPQYIDSLQGNMETRYPELERLLYPGTLPETTMAGGGGIRYNGAGAILLNRPPLNNWLRQAFNDLASLGDRQRNISVAIVISAVGATGSGSLEHLIDIVIKAAQEVGITTPLQCDVFILQPGNIRVTELGEANTVALYAEMAASQHDQNPIARRRYQGRTIMMGWGDGYSLSSLEQLEDITAALIRIINDPISSLASEYFQRLIDNHVLRAFEPLTGLPSHLSTATMVTINLGGLETQFFNRDVNGLLDAMVIGKRSENDEVRNNVFQDVINSYLLGNDAREHYEHLLERISQSVDLFLDSSSAGTSQLRKGNVQAQSARLRGIWEGDMAKLEQARIQMNQQVPTIADHIIKDLKKARSQAVLQGVALTQIKRDYNHFQQIITKIQNEIPHYTEGDFSSRDSVETALKALSHAHAFNANRTLDHALTAVIDHLQRMRFITGSNAATNILRILVRHCSLEATYLTSVINESQRSINAPTNNQQTFQIENKHLLHLPALDHPQSVKAYYDKVSLFSHTSQNDNLSIEDEPGNDSLSSFRQELLETEKLDVLFSGDFPAIMQVFAEYARRVIQKHMQEHTILDILQEQNLLEQRLSEAAIKANALVTLNKRLAPECREMRHVIAFYRDNQEGMLQTAISKAFTQGECSLVKSDDPSEIVVFYYVDGLPMSAVNDLTGRCLNAFLERRRQWHMLNHNGSKGNRGSNRPLSVPVYSGRDAEERVLNKEIIRDLYKVRNKAVVQNYNEANILDLQAPEATNGNNGTGDLYE